MRHFLCFLFAAHLTINAASLNIPYKRYKCINNTCALQRIGSNEGMGLANCRMICGEHGSLWPKPTGRVSIGNQLAEINIDRFEFELPYAPPELQDALQQSANIFRDEIKRTLPQHWREKGFWSGKALSVQIKIENDDLKLTSSTSEEYKLTIAPVNGAIRVSVQACTFYGARHALETLSQLISVDEKFYSLMIVSDVEIEDKPYFSYRGILIDTSRNFYSISNLKRLVRSLSYNKLNVLHWHITDTSSFPMESRRVPKMTSYGAFDPSKVYTYEDIQELVQYAKIRGVRIVAELDAPSHTGAGWQWGPDAGLGDLALCVNQQPWTNFCVEPPCGQLNPVNDNVYQVLEDLYADFSDLFPSDFFHMGGDEVSIKCWKASQEVTTWLKGAGYSPDDDNSYYHLWGQFQEKAMDRLKKVNLNNGRQQKAMLWTSDLVNGKFLDTYFARNKSDYIIEIWEKKEDNKTAQLTEKGYSVVVANYDEWYFDCGFGAWVSNGNSWCDPYKNWRNVYDNNLFKGKTWEITSKAQRELVLGGEAALWSETADERSIEMKLWPRASAVAERLWSNPDTTWKAANGRMGMQRERMVQRGILADAIQPYWCVQNDEECFL